MNLSWLSEPLVHFVILGLLIFTVDRALPPAFDDDSVIAIDKALKSDLASRFTQSTARDPTPKELDQMVEGWIQKEVLYREGITLGLDRSDGLIRDRVISLVRAVTLNAVSPDAPSEGELRDYFQTNREKYVRPRRYDLEHFIIGRDEPDAQAIAETLLGRLGSGREARDVGRRMMRIQGRSIAQLSAIFGAGFVGELEATPVGQWKVARSTGGWHVFRIDSIAPETAPAFETIRKRVDDDWRQEQRFRGAASRYKEMRAKYKIVEVDDSG